MKKTFQLIPSKNSRGIQGLTFETAKEVDVFDWPDPFHCKYDGKWKVVKADDIMWYLRIDNFVCEVTLNWHKGRWYINAGRRPVYGHINLFPEVLERIATTTPTEMVLSDAFQQTGPESWKIRSVKDFDVTPIYFGAEEIWNNPCNITLPNIYRGVKLQYPDLSESKAKHKTRRRYMFYCRNRHIDVKPFELDHLVRLGIICRDEETISTTLNRYSLAVKEFEDVEIYKAKDGALRGGSGDFRINISFANKYHQQQLANLLGI